MPSPSRLFRIAALVGVALASLVVWYQRPRPAPPTPPPAPIPEQATADVTERPLSWIPPGTIVGKTPPEGWSHVVFVAHPRVGSGDVQKVSKSVLHYARLFSVNCLANVVHLKEKGKYRLEQVAIGIGTAIRGENVIISSETQETLGADLDFLARQVLSQCEEDFRTGFHQIIRTPTMMVFDSDAIVLIENEHRKILTRHAIVVSPETGELRTLVWLFDENYQFLDQPIQLLPEGYQEDRVLNVKADKFFLGLPRDGAFAQVRTAQGKPLEMTDRLKPLASRQRYTEQTALALERELNTLWE